MEQFRVAVIGCGSISGNHITGILAAGQKICALCDIVPEHAQNRAKEFELGDIPVYTDYQELLEREHPDIIHVCTPHYLHAPIIVSALNRNINVLSEKPLSINMEQLNAVRTAEKASRAKLGVCHQNRYEPTMLRLKELVEEKGVRAAAGFVVWKRDEAYYRSGAWRGTILQEGGGVMINQALHTLDILQWMCGMPDFVTSHIANDFHKGLIEVEDTAEALFELPGGTHTHFFATTAGTGDLPVQLQLLTGDGKQVFATNSFITVGSEIIATSDSGMPQIGKSVWGKGHSALIADFYHCVRENKPFALDGAEGEKVVRLILSMYHSHGNRIRTLTNS